MHVHILGICGTFMGGIAAIAKAAGHRVTGSDRNVYPPMSTQLAALGIDVVEGFAADQLDPAPDMVVVGNVMTRGVPVIEARRHDGAATSLRTVAASQYQSPSSTVSFLATMQEFRCGQPCFAGLNGVEHRLFVIGIKCYRLPAA